MKLVCVFAAAVGLTLAVAQPHPKLSSGPMLAYSEMTEVLVWVQTKADAQVEIRCWPIGQPSTSRRAAASATKGNDHIAKVVLAGLPMGRRFRYQLWIDGQLVKRDYPLEFRTQPNWRWAQRPAQVPTYTFAVGSCAYINDAPYDRPGAPYGGGYEIFGALHRARPDFMVWLGDNVYYREPDWLTEAAMRYRWRKDRQLPELQPLLASTHHYAVWDDHDFGPNDSDRSFRLRGSALRVLEDYFPSVVRGTPETRGCFFRFEWADAEFFMLDDRYWRSPNNAPDGADKAMLGAGQLQWLKDALLNSRQTFKFIANGGQMVNPVVNFEGFGRFAAEQKDLFDFIASNKIQGVVFLSGDRHAGELLKVQWPGAAYPWYEVTSSPLTAGAGRYEPESGNLARVPGTWVTGTRHYVLVRAEGAAGSRRLTISAHDKAGRRLWSHSIGQDDLRGR